MAAGAWAAGLHGGASGVSGGAPPEQVGLFNGSTPGSTALDGNCAGAAQMGGQAGGCPTSEGARRRGAGPRRTVRKSVREKKGTLASGAAAGRGAGLVCWL